MGKCKCGARWNVIHPYGMKGKSRTVFSIEHHGDCRFNKKKVEERERRERKKNDSII